MSKTKKRVIIISSIIGVFVVLAILFGTLFSLRSVTVDFATGMNRVEAYDASKIEETAGIKKGKNLLFAKFDSNKAKLEEAYPYAKFNIVRKFPNKVMIYVYERTPVFRIQDQSGFWHIYDEELKCLEMVAPINISENGNDQLPVLTHYEDISLCASTGKFISNDNLKSKMTAILDGIYAVGGDTTPVTIMSDIIFEYDQDLGFEKLYLVSREYKTKLLLQDTSTLLKEKIAYTLYVFTSDVSQDENYEGILENLIVECYKNFDPANKEANQIRIIITA